MCEHNCWMRTPKAAKTEATKQKQHTTHDYSIYSSVAISVHCCLHWCSHRHLASVFAPYIYPAILHRCSHLAALPASCVLMRSSSSSLISMIPKHFIRKMKDYPPPQWNPNRTPVEPIWDHLWGHLWGHLWVKKGSFSLSFFFNNIAKGNPAMQVYKSHVTKAGPI